jgi:hypothetical protein
MLWIVDKGMQDSMMADITETIALLQTGDRSGARDRFAGIWSRMQPIPDPFQECVLSHYMADLQDAIDMELMWDTPSPQTQLFELPMRMPRTITRRFLSKTFPFPSSELGR